MARVVTVTGVLLLAVIHVTMSITVQEFFPDLKNNLTQVKWAHKTNSQAELSKVLESSDIMMIEADVIMGTLKGAPPSTNVTLIPVMGHPPENASDLTLEDFVQKVIANKKKGIKLDFKSIEAVEGGLVILKKIVKLGNITVPLWLNADILPGPNATAEEKAVEPTRFLREAAQLPEALLSIGWTTRVEKIPGNVTIGSYTAAQITAMTKTLEANLKSNQSVTYPVRACYAANDASALKTLLSNTKANNPTLTIWSSEDDTEKVDAAKLSQLIKSVGLDKVYVDVPQPLLAKLNLVNSAFTAQSSLAVMIASLVVALFAVKLL